MKYIKLINEFNEYNFKFIGENKNKIQYEFIDINNNKYLVEFSKFNNRYELEYFVYDNEKEKYNVSKIVNSDPYKTLKTIFNSILNDFINKYNPEKINFFGLSKEKEKDFISQRTKIYINYLEKNPINGYELKNIGNGIYLNKI